MDGKSGTPPACYCHVATELHGVHAGIAQLRRSAGATPREWAIALRVARGGDCLVTETAWGKNEGGERRADRWGVT